MTHVWSYGCANYPSLMIIQWVHVLKYHIESPQTCAIMMCQWEAATTKEDSLTDACLRGKTFLIRQEGGWLPCMNELLSSPESLPAGLWQIVPTEKEEEQLGKTRGTVSGDSRKHYLQPGTGALLPCGTWYGTGQFNFLPTRPETEFLESHGLSDFPSPDRAKNISLPILIYNAEQCDFLNNT